MLFGYKLDLFDAFISIEKKRRRTLPREHVERNEWIEKRRYSWRRKISNWIHCTHRCYCSRMPDRSLDDGSERRSNGIENRPTSHDPSSCSESNHDKFQHDNRSTERISNSRSLLPLDRKFPSVEYNHRGWFSTHCAVETLTHRRRIDGNVNSRIRAVNTRWRFWHCCCEHVYQWWRESAMISTKETWENSWSMSLIIENGGSINDEWKKKEKMSIVTKNLARFYFAE